MSLLLEWVGQKLIMHQPIIIDSYDMLNLRQCRLRIVLIAYKSQQID